MHYEIGTDEEGPAIDNSLQNQVEELRAKLAEERTRRRRAEARLSKSEERLARCTQRVQELSSELTEAGERERRRLAIDLHDGLSQTLALTRMKLAALRSSATSTLRVALDEIGELILQADRAARSLSFELSPLSLHDQGLEPAVERLVENIRTRYGIDVTLEDDGRPKPADEPTRMVLFRAIRELLINAAKHARAQRVHVRLERDANQLSAAVRDDGIGMKPGAPLSKGFGLSSLHERLSQVGGSIDIASAPGQGTKIRLYAPLAGNALTSVGVSA